MSGYYNKRRRCMVCGVVVSPTHKYCDGCRRIIRRTAKRVSLDKKAMDTQEMEQQKEKKPAISLVEAVRLADAAGMSYAKYCQKYGI